MFVCLYIYVISASLRHGLLVVQTRGAAFPVPQASCELPGQRRAAAAGAGQEPQHTLGLALLSRESHGASGALTSHPGELSICFYWCKLFTLGWVLSFSNIM